MFFFHEKKPRYIRITSGKQPFCKVLRLFLKIVTRKKVLNLKIFEKVALKNASWCISCLLHIFRFEFQRLFIKWGGLFTTHLKSLKSHFYGHHDKQAGKSCNILGIIWEPPLFKGSFSKRNSFPAIFVFKFSSNSNFLNSKLKNTFEWVKSHFGLENI